MPASKLLGTDPTAATDCATWCESGGDQTWLLAEPRRQELLEILGRGSRYAFATACRDPQGFMVVVDQGLYGQVLGRRAMVAELNAQLRSDQEETVWRLALGRFKHRHFLRIALGDLSGAMGFQAVVAELSDTTDVVVGAACTRAWDRVARRFPALGSATEESGFTVLGMGKLGARELNYSSDIDLIFAYELPDLPSDDAHSAGVRIGAELIRLLDEPGPAGRLYRVDMRLRPEGDRGELALSRRETVDYYYSVGRPWERQAMLKARPIAGGKRLGARLIEELQSFVYPAEPAFEDLEESRSMRRRIEERAEAANVKTGAGGIRDIEFLVQFLQLCYGGRISELRRRDTLPTLAILADRGILPVRDTRALAGHLVWLRTVEHRLQMWEDRQEHAIPQDLRERASLAVRCGYPGPGGLAQFEAQHRRVRAEVRAVVARHFLEGNRDADGLLALVVRGEADPALAARILAPAGVADPVAAAACLRRMAEEPFFLLSRSRTERALVAVLPLLLHLVGASPEPDKTIANLERIVGAVGGRATFFQLLGERPEVLKIFVDLAGWSAFLVELIHERPGLPDDLVDALNQRIRKPIHLQAEARALVRGVATPAEPLAHLVAREQAVAAVHDLGGKPTSAVAGDLGTAAQVALDALFNRLATDRGREWGFPVDDNGRPVRGAILALGKLGGNELSFASDMDITFVCDAGGRCPRMDRDGQEFWTRVAMDLMRQAQESRLFELDTRLRPWGDQGELVPTTAALERYWQDPKDIWERMANVRISPLAGDPRLGAEMCALVRDRALGAPLPGDAAEQVRHMRQRLEHSVVGRDHLKRGWGGYVDHEFIAQFKALGLAPEALPVPVSTAQLLRRHAELGRIPDQAAGELIAGLGFLRFVESRMRLWTGKALSSLPTDTLNRMTLARRCGFEDVQALDLQLHLARERGRRWFDALVR